MLKEILALSFVRLGEVINFCIPLGLHSLLQNIVKIVLLLENKAFYQNDVYISKIAVIWSVCGLNRRHNRGAEGRLIKHTAGPTEVWKRKVSGEFLQ